MTSSFDPRRGLIVIRAELNGPSGSAILRLALDCEPDVAVELILADRAHGDGGRIALPQARVVGPDTQREIGLRRPDDQAVTALLAAVALDVAQSQEVIAGGSANCSCFSPAS